MRKKVKLLASIGLSSILLASMPSNVFAEDFVLYEENGIHVETKGLTDSPSTGTIGLYIENNSNLNLGIAPYAYAINGIMAGGDQYGINSSDVAPGKKANSTLELIDTWENKDFFKDYQMNEVDSFDVLLWAYDNAKSFKAFDSGQIHADVTGTTVVSSPVFDGAQNLYNQNGISVDFISSEGNSFTFCITNTTGQYFAYDVTSETYNDFTMSDSYEIFNQYLLDGCKTLVTLTPTDDFLTANGISDVSNVDFALTIRPLAEYDNEYTTDLISYQK